MMLGGLPWQHPRPWLSIEALPARQFPQDLTRYTENSSLANKQRTWLLPGTSRPSKGCCNKKKRSNKISVAHASPRGLGYISVIVVSIISREPSDPRPTPILRLKLLSELSMGHAAGRAAALRGLGSTPLRTRHQPTDPTDSPDRDGGRDEALRRAGGAPQRPYPGSLGFPGAPRLAPKLERVVFPVFGATPASLRDSACSMHHPTASILLQLSRVVAHRGSSSWVRSGACS